MYPNSSMNKNPLYDICYGNERIPSAFHLGDEWPKQHSRAWLMNTASEIFNRPTAKAKQGISGEQMQNREYRNYSVVWITMVWHSQP
jgi:hypothetical protein